MFLLPSLNVDRLSVWLCSSICCVPWKFFGSPIPSSIDRVGYLQIGCSNPLCILLLIQFTNFKKYIQSFYQFVLFICLGWTYKESNGTSKAPCWRWRWKTCKDNLIWCASSLWPSKGSGQNKHWCSPHCCWTTLWQWRISFDVCSLEKIGKRPL